MKLFSPGYGKIFDPSVAKGCTFITAYCLSLLLTACGGGGTGGVTEGESPVESQVESQVETQGQPEVQPTGVASSAGVAVFGVGTDDPSAIVAPWLASVRLYRSANSSTGSEDISIGALRYGEDRTLQMHIDFYSDQWEEDTCTIVDNSPDGGGSNSEGSPPYVSGGQSIAINAPSGTWYTMPLSAEVNYVAGNEFPGPFPAGSTLSMPGAEFPSVAAYPLFEPAAPVRISPPFGQVIDINSQYSWIPDGDSTAGVTLDFYEVDANGDFLDWSGVYCQLADDGEFTLPLDTLERLTAGPNSMRAKYSRELLRIDYIDGIVFYQRSRVGE